jgi:NADH-quinone oxidoreductase subunit C
MQVTDIRNPISTNGGDWLQKWGDLWKTQTATVKEKFGDAIEEIRMPMEYPTDVPIIYVKKESVIALLKFLKTDAAFAYDFLADLTATDEEVDPRFEVVYNLRSTKTKARIRVKARVAEGDKIDTLVNVWAGANWQEREVFDMFGIQFAGHPDLRRILMDLRWEGHPLRKDYPLRGYQVFTEAEDIDPKLLD